MSWQANLLKKEQNELKFPASFGRTPELPVSLLAPEIPKNFDPRRFFLKMRSDSWSVDFYITPLSSNTSNTLQNNDLEALSFFDRKTSFQPILLLGFSPLSLFSWCSRMNRSKSQFITTVYQPSFLFISKIPLHTHHPAPADAERHSRRQ